MICREYFEDLGLLDTLGRLKPKSATQEQKNLYANMVLEERGTTMVLVSNYVGLHKPCVVKCTACSTERHLTKFHNAYNRLQCAGCAANSGSYHGNTVCTTEEFITKAKAIHGDLYSYGSTEYRSAKDKVLITCKSHGSFHQRPNNHLDGQGCPTCSGDPGGRNVLYIWRDETLASTYKIGISKLSCVHSRIRTVGRLHKMKPKPVLILHTDSAISIEKELHTRLKEYSFNTAEKLDGFSEFYSLTNLQVQTLLRELEPQGVKHEV